MEEFELPVDYRGERLMLKSSLLVTGYSHKINVDVNGQIITFEPDEERNYRAKIAYEHLANYKPVDVELLKSIVASLEKLGR